MDEFRYTLSRQLHKQSPMQLLGPEQVAELVPILNMNNIHGGLFTPNEGHIDPYRYLALQPRADGGWDVVTERGTVRANRVINCAGGTLSCFPPIINL